MKTSEFKKRIRELGLEIVLTPEEVVIVRNADGYYLAKIESERDGALEFYKTAWKSLPMHTRKELSFTLSEYISTPIKEREEREDERLYYLKLKEEMRYLNYNSDTELFNLNDKRTKSYWTTKFTERQIMLLDKEYGILEDYRMIEVE